MRLSQRTRRLAAPVAAIALFAAACGGTTQQEAASDTTAEGEPAGAESDGTSGSVRIDGSSTVAPFGEVAAELFMEQNPDVQVTVGVSGTGGGFEKFCNGETDISEASRPIKDEEAALCEENGIAFEELSVALDGLVNVVPVSNDFVECLTVEELNAIWGPDSTISNWSEVRDGFPDLPLDLYGAGTDSGTFDYFTEEINGESGAIRTDYNASEDDNVTVQGVSGSEGGLGFFGLSYAEENVDTLKALQVDGGDGCVEATVETVQDGSYTPLGRPLFMYPSDVALDRPEVVAFMEYTISNQEEISTTALFVPLTDEQAAEAQAKVDELAGS
ncbi:MAG: PstS family phosphate ABC transporter substrate-binding protein [Nitriliruptor sp.]|uniref:PstS family phosphate ABC transporter substrate-binding protein n=1 Tax=Nitriliruptor sp. TaxID=2448056 RepID=UPI0034A05C6A